MDPIPWVLTPRIYFLGVQGRTSRKINKKYGAKNGNDALLKNIKGTNKSHLCHGGRYYKSLTYLFDRIRLNKELGIGRSAELLNDISHCFCILTDCMILNV